MLNYFTTKADLDINKPGPDDQNCLHYAVSKGKLKMIKYVLDHAKPSVIN